MQEAIKTFDFEIIYQKGGEKPEDFLNRNVVDMINVEDGLMEKD
jgi:hypothetical protein